MNKAIERDLLSLLPSITLPLPRELTEVATSLLSQSRSKVGNLRQDEEIARGYVCANIACDRLKTKLNLPTIIVRPPVGPKTYKKVYAYLDSALTAGTPRKQQKNGTASRAEPTTPSKQRVQSVNGTPSRTPARTPQAKTPVTARSSTKRKRDEVPGEDGLPTWSMPATRALCKAFDVPHTAPHVYVGVSSVAKLVRDQQTTASQTPARKRSRQSTNKKDISAVVSAFDDAHVPALIVVIAFFTRSHQLGAPEPTEYASQRAEAIRTISKVIPEDLQRDEETNIAMVEDLLREAESGWLDMEWYHNLPEPASDADDMVDELQDPIDGEDKMAERRGQSLQVPTRGSGSMMTDATDFLSDERRAEYKRWKGGVLRRIAQIEKQGKGKAIMV